MHVALWEKATTFAMRDFHPQALCHSRNGNGGFKLFQFFVSHLAYHKYNKMLFNFSLFIVLCSLFIVNRSLLIDIVTFWL